MTTAPDRPVVGLLASRVRADDRRILDAFDRRAIPAVRIDPRKLTSSAAQREADPWVVLDREISLTRAVYGASILESRGSVVVNDSAAIARCGDKWLTTRALVAAGVPTPHTVLALTPESALEEVERAGKPLVIKPLTGSWGRRIGRLDDLDSAGLVLEHVAALPSPQSHVVYLQEDVRDIEADVRLLVVGGTVVGACCRTCPGLRKNVALGGMSQKYEPSEETAKVAVRAAEAVGADLAGVDVLVTPDRGPLVLEVNAGVEFSGLQSALGDDVDVAEAIVDHVSAIGAP
jgi:[lysine-biosynthesis-protein LysW]--L-2-aminoadipate ligase